MIQFTPERRDFLYQQEAERTGIHKPILAALYQVHNQVNVPDGETGLGIAPANRIPLDRVNSLGGQVQYAANTIRSLTESLSAGNWQASDFWNADEGRYTNKFVQRIAQGYVPPTADPFGARLERADAEELLQAYREAIALESALTPLPSNLNYLDPALVSLVEQIPTFYTTLPYQREALLESLRIWRRLDNRDAAIASLNVTPPTDPSQLTDSYLDRPLLQFVQPLPRSYTGLPHQREALIRLVQLWRQLPNRSAAIASLKDDNSPQASLQSLDSALMAWVQRIPRQYQAKSDQRNALLECFRVWGQFASQPEALAALGIETEHLKTSDRTLLTNLAVQIDRELLIFLRRVPSEYQETSEQREALFRLVQLWGGLTNRDQTLRSLLEDLQKMPQARRDSPEAPPPPAPLSLPHRPETWTPQTLQIHAPILPNGNFTWAEATQGGRYLPPDQGTVDAIARIAELAQQARDRLGRPFHIIRWYTPVPTRDGVVDRHWMGDAIEFYCDGLRGNQLFWFLDPWWPGGLGRSAQFPYLVQLDARNYRARWQH